MPYRHGGLIGWIPAQALWGRDPEKKAGSKEGARFLAGRLRVSRCRRGSFRPGVKFGAGGLVLGRRWRHAGPGSADFSLAHSAFQRRSEWGGRCRGRDVIARRRAEPEGALTSPRGEPRDNAAASTGWGAGLASAHGLPGEAGDWGRVRRKKVGGSGGRFSLSSTVYRA